MKSIKQNSKKSKRLGDPEMRGLPSFLTEDIDTKVALIKTLIPLGLMAVNEMLQGELETLVGPRYSRGGETVRHGSNPGSVKLGGQRHAVRVPRVRTRDGEEVPLQGWLGLKTQAPDEGLLRRVLYGLSSRDYGAAAEALPGAIGLGKSSVSRHTIEASAAQLKAFQERDLSVYELVGMFIDGKTFAEDRMVIALGVRLDGDKVPLGFVQTGTENAKTLTTFLEELKERGLQIKQGLLVIIDGAKGLRKAVNAALGKHALVQRCQWHKRENVVAYLPVCRQAQWRRRLQRAYEQPTYRQAKAALMKLHKELCLLNTSAAASLEEGLEETLTLHRLGVFQLLGISFKTTNCIESLNSQVEKVCGRVTHWKNSSQKQRWLAAALLDIEPRLRKIKSYKHLPKLRLALMNELKLFAADTKQAA
jgi:transposase-like protein